MELYSLVSEFLFFAFMGITASGAIVAVRAKILMHAVFGLAVCLLGVGGLYYYLGSMFLTMMQILVYVGAICILMVFGIMVGYTPNQVAEKNLKGKHSILAGLTALSGVILIGTSIVRNKGSWISTGERVGDYSLNHLGARFLHEYCLAFELISVVLLAAIIGSIILATIREDGGDDAA